MDWERMGIRGVKVNMHALRSNINSDTNAEMWSVGPRGVRKMVLSKV